MLIKQNNFKEKIICDCSSTSILEAIKIFKKSKMPYKKAKKLVTRCDKICCKKPLSTLFLMLEFKKIDFEELGLLIDQKNKKHP